MALRCVFGGQRAAVRRVLIVDDAAPRCSLRRTVIVACEQRDSCLVNARTRRPSGWRDSTAGSTRRGHFTVGASFPIPSRAAYQDRYGYMQRHADPAGHVTLARETARQDRADVRLHRIMDATACSLDHAASPIILKEMVKFFSAAILAEIW